MDNTLDNFEPEEWGLGGFIDPNRTKFARRGRELRRGTNHEMKEVIDEV